MDEPLSNLDAKLRVSTRAQIKNLQHRLAVTTIYVTHDQVEAMTLADRVVVMERGEIQQIGSPAEIYDQPANVFVAGFIGSPAMNLLRGEIQDGAFVAPGTRVPGFADMPGGPATLGFRAEDVEVASDGEIAAPVYSIEMLGDATLVSLRIGEALVSAKAPRTFRARIGDPIALRVRPETCHLFDARSGRRVAA